MNYILKKLKNITGFCVIHCLKIHTFSLNSKRFINNIASEIEKVCEIIGDLELLDKIKKIPELTLKSLATNQSLYV